MPEHILGRLLGESAFLALIANFGGETINIPSMHLSEIRTIGEVYGLTKRGMNVQQIAQRVGIGCGYVKTIQARIESGLPLTRLSSRAASSSR